VDMFPIHYEGCDRINAFGIDQAISIVK